MKYEVVYSPEALDDLDRVWTEVLKASCNFETADQYIRDLRSEVHKKDKHPKTGIPLSYMGEFSGTYMVLFKAYIAFYRINGKKLEVAKVLYSGSDYMKTLFGRNSSSSPENFY